MCLGLMGGWVCRPARRLCGRLGNGHAGVECRGWLCPERAGQWGPRRTAWTWERSMGDGEHSQNAQEPEEGQGEDSHPSGATKARLRAPTAVPPDGQWRQQLGWSHGDPPESSQRRTALSRAEPSRAELRGDWQLVESSSLKTCTGLISTFTTWPCSEAHLSRVLGTPPGRPSASPHLLLGTGTSLM